MLRDGETTHSLRSRTLLTGALEEQPGLQHPRRQVGLLTSPSLSFLLYLPLCLLTFPFPPPPTRHTPSLDLLAAHSCGSAHTPSGIPGYTRCVPPASLFFPLLTKWRYGTPGSPGLVVVHGNMATRKMFAHFARVMVERHGPMRIYAIDVSPCESLDRRGLAAQSRVRSVRNRLVSSD